MTAHEFAHLFDGCRKAGAGFMVRCPVHGDREQSLSISDGEKGVILNCFAGCKSEDICNTVGLSLCDLFYDKPRSNGAAKRIVAEYSYTDESGAELFQVVRFEPKTFRQRHKQNGEWVWKMEGVRRVLYRLPEVLKAVAAGETVYLVEGEKDVAALVKHGFCATCNAGGAGKWMGAYTDTLINADVVILPDKDGPGREHAEVIAAELAGLAKRVRVVELPGESVKDAADYFGAGNTAEDFKQVLQTAPPMPAAAWSELVEDAADIITLQLPPVVEIVEGLATDAMKLVIASGSKSFKTWLTMYLVLCIAHQRTFWGRATIRKRVLYVNLELKPQTFQRRLQILTNAMGVTVDRGWFHHLSLRGKIAGLTVRQIIDRVITLARALDALIVVIDPRYKLLEGDENSARDEADLGNELDRITTEAGATLILNDHFGKGNQAEKDPLDAIRGSSAKGGDVDAAIVLRKHDVENCFRVDVIHRELPPVEPFCVGWEFPFMVLRTDLDAAKMKKPRGGKEKMYDPADLLKHILDTTPENPISISAWAAKADAERKTLADYTTGFRQKGWIRTIGEGNKARQYITAEGRKAIE